jgi:hypothetical protein
MTVKTGFALCFCFGFLFTRAAAVQKKFDRAGFYQAMDTGKLMEIDRQLDIIRSGRFPGDEGFEATLLMKKAGMVKLPAARLNLFKTGHRKLEELIKNDSSDTELRFLRLMIEEHAPGFLGYKADLENDKSYICLHFNKLLPVVQQAVSRYSLKSKILRPADLIFKE